jgi:hypothetical protein
MLSLRDRGIFKNLESIFTVSLGRGENSGIRLCPISRSLLPTTSRLFA